MIVLDTHIWIWWVHDAPELPEEYRRIIEQHEASVIGISPFRVGKWLNSSRKDD